MNFDKYFTYLDGNLYWKNRPRCEFKSEVSWKSTNSRMEGKVAGSIVTSSRSATKYRQLELFGVAYKCHKVVWEMHNGKIKKDLVIDHVNGNGLDNRIENLRLVDSIESARNLPLQKSNTSGVVGVNWHKSARAWQVRINHNGERIDLGRHKLKKDAIRIRKIAEINYGYHENHGRIANDQS